MRNGLHIVCLLILSGCQSAGSAPATGNSDGIFNRASQPPLDQEVHPMVVHQDEFLGAKGMGIWTDDLALANSRDMVWPAVLSAAINNMPPGLVPRLGGTLRFSPERVVDEFFGGRLPAISISPQEIAEEVRVHFKTVPREVIPQTHYTVLIHELHKPKFEFKSPPVTLAHLGLESHQRPVTILHTKGKDGQGMPLLVVSAHWTRTSGLRTLRTLRVWDPMAGVRHVSNADMQDAAHPDCLLEIVRLDIWSGMGKSRLMTQEEIDAREAARAEMRPPATPEPKDGAE